MNLYFCNEIVLFKNIYSIKQLKLGLYINLVLLLLEGSAVKHNSLKCF